VKYEREHIYDLRSLENYTYVDEYGKDLGINVRHKVRELIDFIQDDDKLREERKKAKKNKDKYVGMSSDAMGMRFGGSGGWDDSPHWKKDEFGDWDPDKGGGMSRRSGRHGSRNFDDAGNNSDDGDRYDSDSEGGSRTRRGREYRDKDSDSLDSTDKRDHNNSKPSTPARMKPTTGVKKLDLGAAAHYGKDPNSLNSSPMKSNPSASHESIGKGQGDLLSDIMGGCTAPNLVDNDFNPRASDNSHASSAGEFGDFTSAFGKPAATSSGNDEFADFGSAFSGGVTSSSSTVGGSSQQFSSGTISSHSTVLSSNGNSDVSQSNTDLLSGLGGVFSSVPPAPLANNTGHSSVLFTTNHNLNPQEVTFTSPGGLTNSLPGATGTVPLQPALQAHQPTIMSSNQQQKPQIGSTWTNSGSLDIDIDNLSISGFRGTTRSNTSAPSMNQLAVSSPTSPTHPQMTVNRSPVMSPGIGGIGLGTTPTWPLQRNLSFPQHHPVHQNQAFK
jgi:hypothetical protein